MDDTEQAKAYAEADFSESHEAFVRHFKSCFPEFTKGEVLDLGCGAADVIIRFARAFPGARITGIDGAQAMLDIGTADILQKGFANRIRLKKCVLPDKIISEKKFDAVTSNSLLHHLTNPLVLWRTVQQCARPNAPVLIMDLFRPDSARAAEDLVLKYAPGAPPVLKRDFYNSLLAAYSVEEIRQQLQQSGLHHYHIETVSDRHVLIWGHNRE